MIFREGEFMKTLCASIGLFVLPSLVMGGCKSYKSDAGVREAIANRPNTGPEVTPSGNPKPIVGTSEDILPDNTLIINKLNLPNEVAQYNRTCVIMQAKGRADVLVKNYKLSTPIKLSPTVDYTLTVEVYKDNTLVYSNAYCETNRTFTAVLGRNIFSIPVCESEKEEAISSTACSME